MTILVFKNVCKDYYLYYTYVIQAYYMDQALIIRWWPLEDSYYFQFNYKQKVKEDSLKIHINPWIILRHSTLFCSEKGISSTY